MPYDRNEPAAWWRDAEPLPPKQDEPAPAPACDTPPAGSPSTTPLVGDGLSMNAPDPLFESRVKAAIHAFDAWRGCDHLGLMAAAVRAALAVPDPRREALERVAASARELRELVRSKSGGTIHAGDVWTRFRDAVDALDPGTGG